MDYGRLIIGLKGICLLVVGATICSLPLFAQNPQKIRFSWDRKNFMSIECGYPTPRDPEIITRLAKSICPQHGDSDFAEDAKKSDRVILRQALYRSFMSTCVRGLHVVFAMKSRLCVLEDDLVKQLALDNEKLKKVRTLSSSGSLESQYRRSVLMDIRFSEIWETYAKAINFLEFEFVRFQEDSMQELSKMRGLLSEEQIRTLERELLLFQGRKLDKIWVQKFKSRLEHWRVQVVSYQKMEKKLCGALKERMKDDPSVPSGECWKFRPPMQEFSQGLLIDNFSRELDERLFTVEIPVEESEQDASVSQNSNSSAVFGPKRGIEYKWEPPKESRRIPASRANQ